MLTGMAAAIGRCCSLIATLEGPIAYHYHYPAGAPHHRIARAFAERLYAYLEQVRMAQQQNGYNCGVIVVDGTRELVRRLAQDGGQACCVSTISSRIGRQSNSDCGLIQAWADEAGWNGSRQHQASNCRRNPALPSPHTFHDYASK
ncbi:hypothetical protein J6524_08705 [Bradyrhizobium sp. WSM 1738]|uniref:hypothetical protein n=1 Tax=Bradyrhizobium hereditatis TaxID=2821405 RepID=UPI001CE2E6C7|nr:hypothetical protein [Bradyrhizobium hereditatis]MCA6114995.1 hypothetical protein [Bradyrhizobium hereditatis]